jgi:hypothetical protein
MSIYLNSVTGLKAPPGNLITGASNDPGLRLIQSPLQNSLTIQNSDIPSDNFFSIRSDGNINVNNNLLTFTDNSISVNGGKLTQNYFNIVESSIGEIWKATEAPRNWAGVAMSADGRYQTAVVQGGTIFISTDYGLQWAPRDFNRNWFTVAMSSDGRYQTAIVNNGQIYTSTDYGESWFARESNRNWFGVAMSADGKYQTAVVNNGFIYTSTDFGVTWTARESNRSWIRVAMSSDGRYQTAVVIGGQIYTSTDYGVTWTARESNRQWQGIAMSADGRYQTATGYDIQIYTSTNYGETWTPRESSRLWFLIAMSADGRYQTVIVTSGQIYTSTDYGVTWVPRESDRFWNGIAMSADGRYQTAPNNNGFIYLSRASIESSGDTITADPLILFAEDTRAGCPGTLAANTPVVTQLFALSKPALVQVHVNTILNHTTRADVYLVVDGAEVTRTLTTATSMAWEPVQLFWTGKLQPGTHSIDYRCNVANVIGCGATWGKFTITFYEDI